MPKMWPPVGKDDKKSGSIEMPYLQEKDLPGGIGMNVEEATRIAKREMNLTEIPSAASEKRAEFARRVYEICQKSKSPGKMSTLEEFI
jgi:hypothetical protein